MRSDALHQRREPDARFLARRIPVSARVVALVHATGEGGRTADAAAAIAQGVGLRREHTLLAGTGAGEDSLDDRLGDGGAAGLAEVLDGRARLTDIAVRKGDRSYVYLPAGESPPRPTDLAGREAFRRFVERIRERDGTLLLHVPEPALDVLAGDLVDGYVALGALERGGPREGAPEYGRVLLAETGGPASPEAEAAGSAREAGGSAGRDAVGAASPVGRTAAAPEPSPAPGASPVGEAPPAGEAAPAREGAGGWSRHRARTSLPVARIAVGVLAVALLAAGWWLLARRSLPDGAAEGARPVSAEAAPLADADPGADAAPDAGTGTGGEPAAALEGAPALPYSVLIASYASPEDAEERLVELREGMEDVAFLVAPTPIRGALYHRVLAGARGDTASAGALMRRLVSAGIKERESGWDVRPVRLAYVLGVHAARDDALGAVRRAEESGIPAYLVPARPSGSDSVYAVYAGAYESESAAEAMGALLEGAGIEATLRPRRGDAR